MAVRFIEPPRNREHAIKPAERGAIETALEPCGALGKNPKLRRLLQDYRREAAEYFRRTEVIRVIHTMVLRAALVEKRPRVIECRLAAFGWHVHIGAGRDMEIPCGLLGA